MTASPSTKSLTFKFDFTNPESVLQYAEKYNSDPLFCKYTTMSRWPALFLSSIPAMTRIGWGTETPPGTCQSSLQANDQAAHAWEIQGITACNSVSVPHTFNLFYVHHSACSAYNEAYKAEKT
jgi:hypothetical protein